MKYSDILINEVLKNHPIIINIIYFASNYLYQKKELSKEFCNQLINIFSEKNIDNSSITNLQMKDEYIPYIKFGIFKFKWWLNDDSYRKEYIQTEKLEQYLFGINND